MLRAGDSGGRPLAADNPGTSGSDECKQQAMTGGLVLNNTTTTMFIKDDIELSELDLDLKMIIEGCECWSPDEFLDQEEQAVDMPKLVHDESAEFKCNDEDVTEIFQRLEYEETTVVVKQRKISVCEKTVVQSEKTCKPTPFPSASDKEKMTREERQALRKENNKKSAWNSRKRKKMELIQLQEEKDKQNAEIESLKKRVEELEEENKKYKEKC